MAPLKNTSSLLLQTRSLYAVSQLRLRNGTNATVSKIHILFNCCILRKAYFRQCSWHCLKTLRVCKSKHRLLIALFHWRCKSAAIRQSSTFDKVCGCRIYRNVYFKRCKWHRLKTRRVCKMQTRSLCRFSALLTKRHNATVSKVDTLFNCCILWNVYFKRCKWHRLKTLRVCLTQTSRIDVCACRARMQQFPKFILCSTVAF